MSILSDIGRIQEASLKAVQYACWYCQTIQEKKNGQLQIEFKQDASPVTLADFGSQALIQKQLRKIYENFDCLDNLHVIAEEDTIEEVWIEEILVLMNQDQNLKDRLGTARIISKQDWTESFDLSQYAKDASSSDGFWAIDPVDGTKGFIRGDQYSVCLSYIEHNIVQLGILGCPNLMSSEGKKGCIIMAIRGKGAWEYDLNDLTKFCQLKRTEASLDLSIEASKYILCESVEPLHTLHSINQHIVKELGLRPQSIQMDSQCKYVLLARNEAQIYVRLPTQEAYKEKIWDHAAGWLIVHETGGLVTDIMGKPLNFSTSPLLCDNYGILATSLKDLHPMIESVAKRILSSQTPKLISISNEKHPD